MGQQSMVCCGLQLLLNVWAGGWRDGMNGADREMRWRDQGRYMRRRPGRGDRCLWERSEREGIEGPRWPRRSYTVGGPRGAVVSLWSVSVRWRKGFSPSDNLKFNTELKVRVLCVGTCYPVQVWFIAWREQILSASWWAGLCRLAVMTASSQKGEKKKMRPGKSYRLSFRYQVRDTFYFLSTSTGSLYSCVLSPSYIWILLRSKHGSIMQEFEDWWDFLDLQWMYPK